MDEVEIKKRVDEVFVEAFEIEPARLRSEMRIFEDLGIDSLDIVDLVVALQKKFNIQIRDDERVRKIRTLGDIYNFILTLESETHFSEA
jgi:acyl carrier protein